MTNEKKILIKEIVALVLCVIFALCVIIPSFNKGAEIANAAVDADKTAYEYVKAEYFGDK